MVGRPSAPSFDDAQDDTPFAIADSVAGSYSRYNKPEINAKILTK
jgi:hypothetical protein